MTNFLPLTFLCYADSSVFNQIIISVQLTCDVLRPKFALFFTRDMVQTSGVPFFFKQFNEHKRNISGKPNEFINNLSSKYRGKRRRLLRRNVCWTSTSALTNIETCTTIYNAPTHASPDLFLFVVTRQSLWQTGTIMLTAYWGVLILFSPPVSQHIGGGVVQTDQSQRSESHQLCHRIAMCLDYKVVLQGGTENTYNVSYEIIMHPIVCSMAL